MVQEGVILDKKNSPNAKKIWGWILKIIFGCFTCCILLIIIWLIGLIYFTNTIINKLPNMPFPDNELFRLPASTSAQST